MNISEWLFRTAKLSPTAPALHRGDELTADYSRFATRAAAIAGALRDSHGVQPGDRVAVFMENRTEYLETMYGVWWSGAVAVPINSKLHGREAAWICEHAQARLAIISDDPGQGLAQAAPDLLCLSVDAPDTLQALRAAAPILRPTPRNSEDGAKLFYTSGTTGRPKGVLLSHRALLSASLCYPIDVDEVSSADCILYSAPMSHGAGFYNMIHTRVGARHCVPPSGGFDPGEILDLAPRLDRVSFFAAPTMVRRLIDRAKAQGSDGKGIRTIVYGGGPMYVADLLDALDALGPRFVQIYGQGEAPMCITALSRSRVMDRTAPNWRERLGSVGVAQSCVELKIGDETGVELPLGETGEIMCRGPQVMTEYWRNPDATAATLQDGWLRTGDVGRMDADGFLWLTDRSKDMIISGGSNVYPREVEEAVLEHPSIHEVSVVGRPHPEWGEEVVAFVVLSPGQTLDPQALTAHCNDRIARFKRPKAWIALPDLPKNAYGKVLKTELRQQLEPKS